MSASTRWLVGIGAATVGLVALSLLVAQLTGREVDLDEGTPEAVVQEYLRAVAAGDGTAAFAFYSSDLQAACDISHLRDALRYRNDNFRASLRDVAARGDAVEVRISITEVYGSGPFGRSESTFDQVFILEEVGGAWRFAEAPWPSWCPTPARTVPGGA